VFGSTEIDSLLLGSAAGVPSLSSHHDVGQVASDEPDREDVAH